MCLRPRPFEIRGDSIMGWFFLSDNRQGCPRHYVEDKNDGLVYTKEGVEHYVERFSLHRKPFAVYFVHKVAGKRQEQGCKYQQAYVQDRAPHEKPRQHLNVHDVPPWFILPQQHHSVNTYLRNNIPNGPR